MVALKETNLLILKLVSIGFLLMITSINSYAHDVERIKKLEQDVQELRTRLNNLETNKGSLGSVQKPINSSDGWQSLANWRQLQTGMSPVQVKDILGEPLRVRGGDVAVWDYQNDGSVTFIRERLRSWNEPR